MPEGPTVLNVIYLLLGNTVGAVEPYLKVKALDPTLASELFKAI
jgi:hypothetical protein